MKQTILCGALVMATGGGVAFVLANRPTAPADTSPKPAAVATAGEPTDPCPTCRTGSAGVTDVVDLTAKFAAKSVERGEFVSFDEPPLARPKGDVQPVGHELPADREVLPPPREVR